MTPERGKGSALDRPLEKRLPEAWRSKTTAFRQSGLVHISIAVGRARNRLARLIATPDAVFSSDISRINDKLVVENESLREQLRSRS